MTKTIRTVIVDDEIHCVETLSWQLAQYCPEIDLVSSFKDALECRSFIENNEIDLLLVDVEMPMLNGIDLLSSIPDEEFKVVFTTAYGDIDGLDDPRVLDVLLKPIDHTELRAIIDRISTEASS